MIIVIFVLLWSTTVPNVAFQLSKTKVQKWFPCRVSYSLGFSNNPIHCSSTLTGVSFDSLVRLAPYSCEHVNMSSVETLGVFTDVWAEHKLSRFFYRKLKPLRNNASPSNTSNAHISQTTIHTPGISSPMCSPCSCGHVDIFGFDIFNVFGFELPEGGIVCIFLELAPMTTLRRSCFTERRAPFETWIRGNIIGCHCRQSSMLNNIGGARTRTFFKLTNRWRSDIFSVFSEALFGLKKASNWSGTCAKMIGVDVSFSLKIWRLPYTGSVREICCFPCGVFPLCWK